MKIFVFTFTDKSDYHEIIIRVFASSEEEAINIMKQHTRISKYFNATDLTFDGLCQIVELDKPKII